MSTGKFIVRDADKCTEFSEELVSESFWILRYDQ